MKISYKDNSKLVLNEQPILLLIICGIYFLGLISYFVFCITFIPEYINDGAIKFGFLIALMIGIFLSVFWFKFTTISIDKESGKGVITTVNSFKKGVQSLL